MHTLSATTYRPFINATDLLYNGTLVNERIACMGVDFARDHIMNYHPTTKAFFEKALERDAKPWDVYGDQLVQATATQQAGRLLSGGRVAWVVSVRALATQADPVALNAKLRIPATCLTCVS
ncbi:hypothetical protein SPBR_05396 [Sporothrix brasiliensis 5110]|uniref:Uncharacterized protein n=1 Tax=Sporothrix brasiliensis 5110 TaxID=1398154 RepID=A0A0C2ELN5_9PEZI|nr:uncharacterized protein SPBR_05396 [Sporothrix brasiliensis 5110]KIH87024.1 hypothetical protein SPBR_05396 [Sporothrix brasiliensis 5110]